MDKAARCSHFARSFQDRPTIDLSTNGVLGKCLPTCGGEDKATKLDQADAGVIVIDIAGWRIFLRQNV